MICTLKAYLTYPYTDSLHGYQMFFDVKNMKFTENHAKNMKFTENHEKVLKIIKLSCFVDIPISV